MDKWIKSLRPLLASQNLKMKNLIVVLGNEACDLDSGVSALALAYYIQTKDQDVRVYPVLNISSKDYVLKTELVHVLEKINIREDDLIFRDTIDLKKLDDLKLMLVDHNVLSKEDSDLEKCVVEVIDHHALERKENETTRMTVKAVGSCSTLVAEKIFSENPEFSDAVCLNLILQTILMDTVALKKEAKKVTENDINIVERIEAVLGPADRTAIFEDLWKAKGRYEHFSAYQLLRRDLKCVQTEKLKISLSSVPLLVEDFLSMKGVSEDLLKFVEEENVNIAMVLGYSVEQGTVRRDLLISCTGDTEISTRIAEALQAESAGLQLTHNEKFDKFGRYFHQGNVAGSRKQILPIVKRVACQP